MTWLVPRSWITPIWEWCRFISIQKLINVFVEDVISNGRTRIFASGPGRSRNLIRSKVMGGPICRVSSLVSHDSVRNRHSSLNLRGRGTQALHLRQVWVIGVPAGKLVGLFADPAVAMAVSKIRLESLQYTKPTRGQSGGKMASCSNFSGLISCSQTCQSKLQHTM